jgi:hypothetical protein
MPKFGANYPRKCFYQAPQCNLLLANIGNATVGWGILSKVIGRITMNISELIDMISYVRADTIIPIHGDAFAHYNERNFSSKCTTLGFRFLHVGESVSLL